MEIHATWITGIETWYITNAKTGDLLRKICTYEEYPKYKLEERTIKETIPTDTSAPLSRIGVITALGEKLLIATTCGLGYIVLETKNWEKKWRIPAVPTRAAIAIDWPQYSRTIANLDQADKLYDDEKTVKKLIEATKLVTMRGIFGRYWDQLYRPTVSEDRYLLLSLMNEWKIYDLKTGEWVGKETEVLLTGYTMRTPMGTVRSELLRRLISIVEKPEEVLYESININFEPRASFLPKRKRILITNESRTDVFLVLDGETGEIVNQTTKGYNGWPTNPLNLAIKTGILEEYEIPHRQIKEIYKKDVYWLGGYAWGPNNEIAIGLLYIKRPVEENKGISLILILDEKGRLAEHVALIMEKAEKDGAGIFTAYRNGATLAEGINLWKDPFPFAFLTWHPKPYMISGAINKLVYWPSKKLETYHISKNIEERACRKKARRILSEKHYRKWPKNAYPYMEAAQTYSYDYEAKKSFCPTMVTDAEEINEKYVGTFIDIFDFVFNQDYSEIIAWSHVDSISYPKKVYGDTTDIIAPHWLRL
ncbi:MAG: hypothetical protein Q6363_008485 [Candidatus Njordarchaeota archaeon]